MTLEAIVSNSPIGAIVQARQNAINSEFSGPADEAYERLMTIRDNRTPISIRTSLKSYDNMVLKTLTIPRSADVGDAIKFSATFVQVQIVQSKRFVRVAIPMATAPTTVTKPPTPLAKGLSFNDSLPVYRVLIKVDVDGFARNLWFDDSINGWRETAVYDAPQNQGVLGVTTTANPDKTPEGGWVLYKGKPFGVAVSEWNGPGRKTDAQYRDLIAAERVLNPDANRYDPTINFGVAPGGNQQEFLVHAMRR